jgi:hypothetical protein
MKPKAKAKIDMKSKPQVLRICGDRPKQMTCAEQGNDIMKNVDIWIAIRAISTQIKKACHELERLSDELEDGRDPTFQEDDVSCLRNEVRRCLEPLNKACTILGQALPGLPELPDAFLPPAEREFILGEDYLTDEQKNFVKLVMRLQKQAPGDDVGELCSYAFEILERLARPARNFCIVCGVRHPDGPFSSRRASG